MMRKYLFLRAPAEAPTAPPAPVPTAEEIQAQAKQAMDSMFGSPPPKAEVEEPVVETPPVETPPAAPAAPVTPAAPAAPAAPEKTEAEKRAELVKETADAVAERLKPATPPAAPAAPATAPAQPEMGKEDKADYEVLLTLAQTNPEYAEKAEKFARFVTASYVYQDEWLAKNPGKEFNANDDEHSDWYEANQQISPEDLVAARKKLEIKLEAKQEAEKIIAPMKEKLLQRERQEVIDRTVPVVVKNIVSQVVNLVEKVDPALAVHLKDEKGEAYIGVEAEQKVTAADPVAAREILKAVNSARPMIMELEKSAIKELGYQLQTIPWVDAEGKTHQPIALHLEIDEFRKQAEADILAKPEAERSQDGKPFVTQEVRQAELAKIWHANHGNERKQREEMDKYDDSVTMVTVEAIEAKIIDHFSSEAKKVIGEINSAAEKKFKPSTPAAVSPTAATPSIHAAGSNKPKSPSLGAQTPVVTTPAAGQAEQKNLAQQATKSMFGK